MSINWRDSGDTTYADFQSSLPAKSVIIQRGEVDAVYRAASPYTRLFRGMLQAESSGGIDFNAVPASFNNPVNLRVRGKESFQQFPTLAACAAEWRARITDPQYAYRGTQTVAEMVHVYAPSSDNNNEAAYVATVERVIQSLPLQQKGTSKVNIPTTHSVKQPPIYDLATDYARFGISRDQATEIINSRFENRSGADPRFPVCHIQDGITTGSLPYWASPAVDASSTVMIQRDGSILKVVPEEHGPWTNGDVNRPTAQANEILALGGNPNIWTLSIEAEGDASNTLTAPQRDAVIWQIEDWIMRYPRILDSEWCMLEHAYINSVDRSFCGLYLYGAGVVDAINDWLSGAAAPAVPTPPAKPEPPKSPYPPGMTPQMAKRLYGSLTVPWSSKPFTFDLARSECRYWLAHGAASIPEGGSYQQGHFAKLDDVIRRGDGKTRTFQWGDLLYEQVVKGQ